MKAYKLQKKASKVGFDWDSIEGVFDKIEEELGELRQAVAEGQSVDEQVGELGDLLFAAANAARFLDADPEEALSRTNRKFVNRFRYIEDVLHAEGKTLQETSLDEMETIWQQAKNEV
ncbi:MazG nucleotide pyrophosphohydrolase domain-containing protein [Paenibacillus sp. AR247]|uniref:MazG nucleotide pyrophosphohydrolase domain-containing protein n=2 Tax=Paenibacillus TaxID=44249 RepID=UPI0026B05F05